MMQKFLFWCLLLRLQKTGGLDWWYGVGGKALFFDSLFIFSMTFNVS